MIRLTPEEQLNKRMKDVLRKAIRSYNHFYREKILPFDGLPIDNEVRERERLLRGIVRGAAMMKHARDRPAEVQANTPNYSEWIKAYEFLHGLQDFD